MEFYEVKEETKWSISFNDDPGQPRWLITTLICFRNADAHPKLVLGQNDYTGYGNLYKSLGDRETNETKTKWRTSSLCPKKLQSSLAKSSKKDLKKYFSLWMGYP